MNVEALTLREASRQLKEKHGIERSHSTLSRYVAAGKIPDHGDGKSPRIFLADAKAALVNEIDTSKHRHSLFDPAHESDADEIEDADEISAARTPQNYNPEREAFNQARTQREILEAERRRLDLEERRGNLVTRSSVEAAMTELGHKVRAGLMRTLDEVVPKLQGMNEPGEISALLQETHERVLAMIADEFDSSIH